jgi:hypothetical protein
MATGLFAQPKSDMQIPRNIIKFSPQHLIRGGLWMSGEFLNKDLKRSHQISVETMYRQPNNEYGITKGIGITAEYMFKYYLSKFHIEKSITGMQTVNGYYVGIFGQYGYFDETSRYTNRNNVESMNQVTTTVMYPGFVIGFQKSLGESFYADFYAGAGMRITDYSVKNEADGFSYRQSPGAYFIYNSGLLPKIGMTLGFGF